MVLQEVQHTGLKGSQELPFVSQPVGRLAVGADGFKSIVEARLVVEIVESGCSVLDVVALVVDFGDEEGAGVLLPYAGYGPFEELRRYKLHHIAPEAVDTHIGPVQQYVEHLVPGEAVVVVELYRVVPVGDARMPREAVVACGQGGIFIVQLSARNVVGQLERPVEREEVGLCEVVPARMVTARHVVRHGIYHHLQSGLVGALHQRLELIQPVCGVFCKFRGDVVVVSDRVGAAGLSLYYGLAVCRETFERCGCGMGYHACVPNRTDRQVFLQTFETFRGYVVELAASVGGIVASGSPFTVAHNPYEHLV